MYALEHTKTCTKNSTALIYKGLFNFIRVFF